MKHEEFAVVLLDVLMPGTDGFETARRVRTSQRSRHTPIIFLTSFDLDAAQIEEGYALGAVDFLVKPLSPIVLRARCDDLPSYSKKSSGPSGKPSNFGSWSREPPNMRFSCSIQMAMLPRGTPGRSGSKATKPVKSSAGISHSSIRPKPMTKAGPPMSCGSPGSRGDSRTRAGESAKTDRGSGPMW